MKNHTTEKTPEMHTHQPHQWEDKVYQSFQKIEIAKQRADEFHKRLEAIRSHAGNGYRRRGYRGL